MCRCETLLLSEDGRKPRPGIPRCVREGVRPGDLLADCRLVSSPGGSAEQPREEGWLHGRQGDQPGCLGRILSIILGAIDVGRGDRPLGRGEILPGNVEALLRRWQLRFY